MNKLNLPPFFVGQKVVYIGIDNSLKNKTFVVKNILKCTCGCYKVDVGFKLDNLYLNLICTGCDKLTFVNSDVSWYASHAFAPLQQQNFPLIKLSKIMEKEKEEVLIPN